MPSRMLRARLIDRLVRAAAFPVTLIVAPAGFGKSVALRDFLETRRVEAVRFDVARDQDTLLAFVRGLAGALAETAPSALAAFPSLETRLMAAAEPARECAEWICEHLKRTVCTIVIDDLHHAAVDQGTVAFLVEAVARTSGRISWIVATRTDADLPVASWMAYGTSDAPVGEDDLRFTEDEALAAAETFGGASDAGEIAALRDLTGGWAVALTIALRTRTNASDLRSIAAGTREMVYRYLAEQVFAELAPEVRRLLIDTCVFSSFDAQTGESLGASPETFAALRRVPFVSSSEGGYRYHDLFRDFLESELRRSSARDWRAAVARAAELLEDRGDAAQALRLWTRIADEPAVVRAIERHGFDLVERGEAETVAAALQVLGREAREGNAMALGIGAMLAAARGRFDVADRMFRAAVPLARDPLVGWSLAYRHALELVRHGRDCGPLLEPLVDLAGMPDYLRAAMRATLATAYAADGRQARASAMMDEALDVSGSVTRDDGRARIYQQAAYVFQFDDDHARATSYAELAVETAERAGLFDIAARAYSVLYNIVYEETDDPIAVLSILDRLGESARKAASDQVRLFGLIGAYEIEAERGDDAALDGLDAQLSRAASMLPRSRAESLLPAQALRRTWRREFAEAWSMLAGTAAQATTPGRRAVRAAESALYAAAAGLVEEAEFAIREAREALALCAEPDRRTGRARALLAMTETLRGRSSVAHRDLVEAQRAAAPHLRRLQALVRTARTFYQLSIGQADDAALAASLERLRSDHMGGAARMIAMLPPPVPSSGAYASLTAAERRILDLLVAGASTKEIAEGIDRSPQTVDTHVRAICRKLECRGRREAVALAMRSGWS
ncbi:MAG TPA: LuxR C-terminal-related transcriptional regulator [Candidatus Baltobacteraceae bacterium]